MTKTKKKKEVQGEGGGVRGRRIRKRISRKRMKYVNILAYTNIHIHI